MQVHVGGADWKLTAQVRPLGWQALAVATAPSEVVGMATSSVVGVWVWLQVQGERVKQR